MQSPPNQRWINPTLENNSHPYYQSHPTTQMPMMNPPYNNYLPLSLTQHIQQQQQQQQLLSPHPTPPAATGGEPVILIRSPKTSRHAPKEKKRGASHGGGGNGSQTARLMTTPHTHTAPYDATQFPPLSPTQPLLPWTYSSSTLPFVNPVTADQMNAKLNSNMIANASRTPQTAALLQTPLSPHLARTMQQPMEMNHSPSGSHMMLHSPSYTGTSYYQTAQPSSQLHPYKNLFSPSRSQPLPLTQLPHALPPQLVLPPEFVVQQTQKMLAQQSAEARPKSPTEEKQSRPSTAAFIQTLLHPPPLVLPQANSPQHKLRSPPHSARRAHEKVPVKYVPARVPDVAYQNMKKRSSALVEHFKKAATAERSASVQLEMRGSVRFDMSNPKAIFDAVTAQANKPVEGSELNFNEKHEVRLKDGSIVTVFGRILERSDNVRENAISQFFLSRKENNLPTLDRFVTENFAKDQSKFSVQEHLKHDRQNKERRAAERKERMGRTDEELLSSPDDILTPLERWKRDQLKQKLAKQQAEENALKEHRAKQNELLKLRLEKERFEREEREKLEKEQAEKAAKLEEERLYREAENQRQYRELVMTQAQETKLSRAEQEAAKKREEEEAKRLKEEARKKALQAEGFIPSFMKPLDSKVVRSQQEDAMLARIKDHEKDWAIARAKLKAEIVRIEELIRKRERAAKLPVIDSPSVSTIKDPIEFQQACRKLRNNPIISVEENKLKELERLEQEAKGWLDKVTAEYESWEARQRQRERDERREREETLGIQRSGTRMKANATLSSAAPSPAISASPSSASLHASNSTRSVRMDGGIEEESDQNSSEDAQAAAARKKEAANRRRSGKNVDFTPSSPPGLPKPSSGGTNRSPKTTATSTPAVGRSPGTGRSRATSRAASPVFDEDHSRSGSKSNSHAGSRIHSPAISPTIQSRRASGEGMGSGHTSDLSTLKLDGDTLHVNDRRSSMASNTSMDPSTSAPSGVVSPTPPTDEFVNERTLAIDADRARMVSAQAEFEARIKALTSFQPTSPTKGKKGHSKKASVSVTAKEGGGKTAGKKKAAKGVAFARQASFNKQAAAIRSPVDSDQDDDAEDAKLMKSLAQAGLESPTEQA